jgi:hypothetical protein
MDDDEEEPVTGAVAGSSSSVYRTAFASPLAVSPAPSTTMLSEMLRQGEAAYQEGLARLAALSVEPSPNVPDSDIFHNPYAWYSPNLSTQKGGSSATKDDSESPRHRRLTASELLRERVQESMPPIETSPLGRSSAFSVPPPQPQHHREGSPAAASNSPAKPPIIATDDLSPQQRKQRAREDLIYLQSRAMTLPEEWKNKRWNRLGNRAPSLRCPGCGMENAATASECTLCRCPLYG